MRARALRCLSVPALVLAASPTWGDAITYAERDVNGHCVFNVSIADVTKNVRFSPRPERQHMHDPGRDRRYADRPVRRVVVDSEALAFPPVAAGAL